MTGSHKTTQAPAKQGLVIKRGGRDSNPQPPDRQSGELTPKCFCAQGLAPTQNSVTATGAATAADSPPSDPDLAAIVAAWDDLPPAIRRAVRSLIDSATEGHP